MHIEPGVVTGGKLILSYATAVGSFGLAVKMVSDTVRAGNPLPAVAVRSAITTALVFSFFEVLPHYPAGVSEVHLILGSTLFLIFGAGPAAIGLAFGLLIQGLFFAPFDLPQYGMNVTTLIVPLFALSKLAPRIIHSRTAYKDVCYWQALALSSCFQFGVVSWVAFWAIYGGGFSVANLSGVVTFGVAYLGVLLVEPLVDLTILATVKSWSRLGENSLVQSRFFTAAP